MSGLTEALIVRPGRPSRAVSGPRHSDGMPGNMCGIGARACHGGSWTTFSTFGRTYPITIFCTPMRQGTCVDRSTHEFIPACSPPRRTFEQKEIWSCRNFFHGARSLYTPGATSPESSFFLWGDARRLTSAAPSSRTDRCATRRTVSMRAVDEPLAHSVDSDDWRATPATRGRPRAAMKRLAGLFIVHFR